MQEQILVKGPMILDKKILSFDISCSKNVDKFFSSKRLIVEYPVDIDFVDPSIQRIPALASIVTVAWAVGADVYIEPLDKNFLESLHVVKSVMKKWYPHLSFSTKIITSPVSAHECVVNGDFGNTQGLLFTGGIDSTTSYIKHRKKGLSLISISGEGESIDNQSRAEKLLTPLFNGKERHYLIKTNVERIINRRLVYEKFGLNWWMNLSHGIVLSGHCAPLTTALKINTLIIASSFTRDFNFPWGSHPSIDNNIRWANTRVIHDGFDSTRQEKIMYILKEYLSETGTFPILRVCSKYQIEGKNCQKCEKCCRTITGLLSEGINPNKCGFNITPYTLKYIKKTLQTGGFFRRRGITERQAKLINRIYPIFEWEDIQQHLPENICYDLYDSKIFFEWFRHFNIRKRATEINPSNIPRLFLYSFFDFLAPKSYLFPEKILNLIRKSFDYLFSTKL